MQVIVNDIDDATYNWSQRTLGNVFCFRELDLDIAINLSWDYAGKSIIWRVNTKDCECSCSNVDGRLW